MRPGLSQSGSLHLHPYYYLEFSSPYPSHLPLRGTTSPPHLQRTLRFHSPPGLAVYAGSFSSTTSQFPGIGSRGAELRSNFLGTTHSRHKRTAIGGFTGGRGCGGSCRDVNPRRLSPGPKRTFQKDSTGGLRRGGGRSRECAVARSEAPPNREPDKGRTVQPMRAWSPASSPTHLLNSRLGDWVSLLSF